MLKRFELSNFKSFKNHTSFELEKTNYQMLSETNVKEHILKGLMFVGGNASGKSNSVLGIKVLLEGLLGKSDVNFKNYICLFSDNPIMILNYVFEIDGIEIAYRIQYQNVDNKINEDLYVAGECIFTRDGSVANVKISHETNYTDVPNDILFLREIYFSTKFRGQEILQKWFAYLKNSVYIDVYEQIIVNYGNEDLLLVDYLEKKGSEEINHFFQEYKFQQQIEYDKKAVGNILTLEASEKMVFFRRQGIEEPMPYNFESLGNKNLLQLLPSFFHCVQNGGMLILDEFSSGFHNELEELLIRYFMKKASNSQLIFVSHSTNLLSNRILRPDQLYSIEFDENGSKIKRFSSEKPREAQNLEKMYLGGVFNGIPKYEHTIK